MARTNNTSTTAQSHEVFASIFPRSTARPPRSRKQFERKDILSLDAIRQQLTLDAQQALGIGNPSHVSYLPPVNGRSVVFRPYFQCSKSDNMSPLLSLPSPHIYELVEKMQPAKQFANQRSWKCCPSWAMDFGTTRIEKVFAAVMDQLITEFVTWSYGGAYDDAVAEHLETWVRLILWPFVSMFLDRIRGLPVRPLIHADIDSPQRWTNIALTRLADLRIAELFDIVVEWDSTASAVDDLKPFTASPVARSYLTSDFSNVLVQRLLHPGASTIEILQVYISIIRAFRRMEPKGVILERVARRIRSYLRTRDDTIKVVVAGLLADVPEDSTEPDPEVLAELAAELQQRGGTLKNSDEGLDWDDMDWNPDPVDAAPDYLKSKGTDVIGSMISLLESKDVFVKELQTMLADRLLKDRSDFDQEISVIEHLKIRLGDAALQGCEVMLRDVLDSKKVDQVIRQDRSMDKQGHSKAPELHTKILSRLFWPSLQEQTFKLPSPIRQQQEEYEKGFESLKQSRKLTWLNAIGQVEVELELEDRTFHDEVLPWQASVIYAFQRSQPLVTGEGPISMTLASLASELEMTPALVRSACMFWASKQILVETSRDTFAVLETLPTLNSRSADPNMGLAGMSETAPGMGIGLTSDTTNALARAAAAEAAAAQAAKEAEDAERKQKMAMYHQFIISMLTNQGAMPLPRIAMMLGMVVPGGFPFGNEELREFMMGMVREGILEIGNSGAYKIKS